MDTDQAFVPPVLPTSKADCTGRLLANRVVALAAVSQSPYIKYGSFESLLAPSASSKYKTLADVYGLILKVRFIPAKNRGTVSIDAKFVNLKTPTRFAFEC